MLQCTSVATKNMMYKAAGGSAQQTGLISLSKLNRSLWEEPPKHDRKKHEPGHQLFLDFRL